MGFKIIILTLVVLLGVGCAPNYGNYAATTPGFNEVMAKDATLEMTRLYPPARTQFKVVQPLKDMFGISLIAALRLKGYSMYEAPKAQSLKRSQFNNDTQSRAINLSYVVDALNKNALYRVTINLNAQSISRAYVVYNAKLVPAGAWVRQE